MELMETYNLIDLCVVGTILITLILGIWKGFVRSLTGLAGVILGVVLAAQYHKVVAPYLAKISSLDSHISMILSMIIVFVVVQVAFVVIRRILDKLLDVTKLSWLDRVFGAAMGVAAGFLVVASAVQGLLIGVPEWPLVKTSKLVGPVDRLTDKAIAYAPPAAKAQWQAFVSKWKGSQQLPPFALERQSVPSKTATSAPPGVGK
jgi:membrane protein required for colicin V production